MDWLLLVCPVVVLVVIGDIMQYKLFFKTCLLIVVMVIALLYVFCMHNLGTYRYIQKSQYSIHEHTLERS